MTDEKKKNSGTAKGEKKINERMGAGMAEGNGKSMGRIREIVLLTGLELRGLYGFNTVKYTKDKKAKNRYLLLAGVIALLILMVWGYVGAQTLGLVVLGLSDLVVPYLAVLASLLVLAFGIFKAGSTIFARKGYEMLSALPVRQSSIVTSRFLTMYAEDLFLTLVIFVPGLCVYGFLAAVGMPSVAAVGMTELAMTWNIPFILTALIGMFFVPLLPLVVSTAVGAAITAVSSRMKHKTLVEIVLTLLFVVGIFALSGGAVQLEESFTPELLKELATVIGNVISSLYPPAMWLGEAALGNVGKLLLFVAVSLGTAIVMLAVLSRSFHSIIRRLSATSATHDYRMEELKSSGMLTALYKKELKRYFASSIYVTNTIMGPVMALIMAVALLVAGVDSLTELIPVPFDITFLVPFVLAMTFTMMTTTAVSISMEGKEMWILKTLPVTAKTVFDAKILLNLSLIAPFYVVSEILMILAVKPDIAGLLWLVLIPCLMILFAVVFGITVNIKLHSFDWTQEGYVVKQSAPAALGGFAGPLVSMVCGAVAAVTIFQFGAMAGNLVQAGVCVVLAAVTWGLYRKNNKVRLENL